MTQLSLLELSEIDKTCQDRDCGQNFLTSDPDRKFCDLCLVERINGAGILEDDDDDEPGLFDTPPPVRTPTRARVICLVCGHEARIPILADAKICDMCFDDLPGQLAIIEAALDDATQRSYNADLDLHTLLADAHEQTLARYQNAVALREAGDPRIVAAWAKALAVGDGLSALLTAHDTHIAAAQALNQLLVQSHVALAEIAKVR